MPIKLSGVADSLESVPESFHGNYDQRDGKFYLREVEFEDPAEFRTKLNKKEKLITDANAKLGRYNKFQEFQDEELDELLTLRDLKKQGKALTTDEKAELERIHQKTVKKLTDEQLTDREKLKTYETELKRFKLTDPIRAIATSEKVGMFAEDFDLAWSEIGSRFRLMEEDGKKPRIVVLDEDGDETDIKIEDFFTKLYKQQRPKFFKPSGAAGGGATTTTVTTHNNGQDLSELPPMERINAARQQQAKT